MLTDYHSFIQKGLNEKYMRQAGPVQEIELTYNSKDDILINSIILQGDSIEVDFIANLKEIKTIYSDVTKPLLLISYLDNVAGTLFIKKNQYDDLIMEFNDETI